MSPQFGILLLAEQGVPSMARTVATLPSGSRLTDFISFGILARAFPIAKVHEALAATGKADLPAHVVVYYVLALSLYMQSSSREVLRCLLEGLAWLRLGAPISIAGKSGISQAVPGWARRSCATCMTNWSGLSKRFRPALMTAVIA